MTQLQCKYLLPKAYFNPHSREGSDILENFKKVLINKFQSTLPRREWQKPDPCMTELTEISIHTPAKGVTENVKKRIQRFFISIHTPAKGVTWLTEGKGEMFTDFNPHSREGSDGIMTERDIAFVKISIHTPAKGVTIFIKKHIFNSWISIHTPAKGVTLSEYNIKDKITISIHTPAKGVTQSKQSLSGHYTFQSTLPRREWR